MIEMIQDTLALDLRHSKLSRSLKLNQTLQSQCSSRNSLYLLQLPHSSLHRFLSWLISSTSWSARLFTRHFPSQPCCKRASSHINFVPSCNHLAPTFGAHEMVHMLLTGQGTLLYWMQQQDTESALTAWIV